MSHAGNFGNCRSQEKGGGLTMFFTIVNAGRYRGEIIDVVDADFVVSIELFVRDFQSMRERDEETERRGRGR